VSSQPLKHKGQGNPGSTEGSEKRKGRSKNGKKLNCGPKEKCSVASTGLAPVHTVLEAAVPNGVTYAGTSFGLAAPTADCLPMPSSLILKEAHSSGSPSKLAGRHLLECLMRQQATVQLKGTPQTAVACHQ